MYRSLLTCLLGLLLLATAANAGRFEVVASTAEADATLQSYTLCPAPDGKGQMMVMNFRRDQFILAVNLQTGEVRQHSLEPGQAWAITTGPDGKVYLGTSLSPGALLLRYDPAKDEVEPLARAEGEVILAWLGFSPDGTLYGGTYPSTSLVRYRGGKLENLGPMAPGQTHNMFGAIPASGKVYSGIGMKEESVVEYDPKTGQKRNLWPEAWKTTHAARVYLGADGLVYAYPAIETEASKGMALRVNADGSVSEIPRNKMVLQAMGCYPKSAAARPLLEDGSRITEVTRERIVITPAEGGEPRTLMLKYRGAVKPIFGFGFGPDGKIYGSSKPAVLFSFDPGNDRFEDLLEVSPHKAGQVYRKLASGGKVYMGSYTHAMFHVYDPAKPTERARTIGPVGGEQDRPVDMALGEDGRIYIASLPGYGKVDGALSIFHPEEERFENFVGVIPQHGVNALALDERRDRVYLGTHNVRGVGTEPLETDAVVAEWDRTTQKVLRSVQPVPGEKVIVALIVLEDGTLCGQTAGGYWFGIDPKTFAVKFTKKLAGRSPTLVRVVKDPEKGVLYGMAGGAIWKAPLQAPEQAELLDRYEGSPGGSTHYGVEIDSQGRLYFSDGRDLVRWTP